MKRLNKAISETGYCSRREADKLIESGKVKINGVVADLGTKVSEKDCIQVAGQTITKKVPDIYLVFHKPRGIICTTDKQVKDNIISFLNYPQRIFPIGRLDRPSEGLIFLTNDGDIVNKILRAHNKHEKEYIVTVNRKITSQFIRKMGNGIPILGTVTKQCEVEQINEQTFRIVLTQGLNRQIRRMCEYLGYEVKKLKRVRIMNIRLEKLKAGQYRHFTQKELNEILEMVENSSKTQ